MASQRFVVTLLFLAAIGATGPASAQEEDAEALTRQGLELRRAGDDEHALEVFRRAHALAKTPRNLAQIALAEQALGKWIEAEADLARALSDEQDPWIAKNRATLDSGLADIRAHLSWLEIVIEPFDAEVKVNGAPLSPFALRGPVRVVAGSLIIDARAKGYAPARRITTVAPGETAREPVRLVVEPAPPISASTTPLVPTIVPTREVTRQEGNPTLRWVGIATLGAGVAGLVLGTVYGLDAISAKNERDRDCAPPNPCGTAGVERDGAARTFATNSTIAFALGVGAVAAGTLLVWMSRSRTVRVATSIGPTRAALTVGGSF